MGPVAAFLGGFAFRAYQITIESSLYLLIGFLTAGALRGLMGPAKLRAIFGVGRWSGPIRAWAAAATLLPVCALGVLPVLRELRRAGVRRDAVLTFALAAPMLNPISLMYGFSYLGPALMLTLTLGTLVVSVLGGFFSGPDVTEARSSEAAISEEAVPSIGLRRVAASAVHAAHEATGPALRDVAIGIVAAAVIAACLQPDWLSGHSFAGDPESIPVWAAVSPLTYVTPEKGIVILPEMIKFRQSAGAMFCLMVLGVGMTLGHHAWIIRTYGPRTSLRWMATVFCLTVASAYIVDAFTPPVGTANVDNDHFEAFANPFDAARIGDIPLKFGQYSERVGVFQWAILAALCILMAAGVLFRRGTFGRRIGFEDFLPADATDAAVSVASSSSENRPFLQMEVSRALVSAIAFGCGLMVLAAGALAFFPAPEEVFRDMTIIKADLFGEIASESTAASLHHLDLWDRQATRLPFGAMIRMSPPSEEARRRTAELRGTIRDLRLALEANRRDEAKSIFTKAQGSLEKCRTAYSIP